MLNNYDNHDNYDNNDNQINNYKRKALIVRPKNRQKKPYAIDTLGYDKRHCIIIIP